MIKVIYDTDPGIDDAVALHFACECKDIDIVGITTVFGNNTIEVTTRNALYLKDQFKLDCPVAKGSADPLVIGANPPSVVAHGNDGLGDAFDITPRSTPDSWQTAQLAGLLEVPEGQRVSVMKRLRKGPVAVRQAPAI
ncbi:hypothetical protein D9G29_20635 [Escherichia coli]|nr:hypothetical protein [Escherichia coli]MHU11393.1 hypothetical protein [Escherichia coli]